MARRALSWMLSVGIGFVFFTVSIQLLVGMATGQHFLEMTWTGSTYMGGILAIIFGSYESLET